MHSCAHISLLSPARDRSRTGSMTQNIIWNQMGVCMHVRAAGTHIRAHKTGIRRSVSLARRDIRRFTIRPLVTGCKTSVGANMKAKNTETKAKKALLIKGAVCSFSEESVTVGS